MKCDGCGKSIMTRIGCVELTGKRLHKKCFKCKSCGLQLSVKSCKVYDEDFYCIGHIPAVLLLRSPSVSSTPSTPYQPASVIPDGEYAELMPEWFHNDLSRDQAELLLHKDGDFLVRTSQHKPGECILCVKWKGRSLHFTIPRDPVSGGFVFHKTVVRSVKEWINLQLSSGKPVSENSPAILRSPVTGNQPKQRPVSLSPPVDRPTGSVKRQPKEERPSSATAMPRESGIDAVEIVKIENGSVCDQRVDAVVNSTSHLLDLQSGALSRAILTKAGTQIQQELYRLAGSGTTSNIIVTNGYNLPCQFVLHVIFSQSHDFTVPGFRGLVKSIFAKLQELKLTSVAIPPIGTGGFGYQANVVAKILCEEAAYYLNTTSSPSLKDIRFVVMAGDKASQDAFRQALAPEVEDDESGYVKISSETLDAAKTFANFKKEVGEFKARHGSIVKLPENWRLLGSNASHQKTELDRSSLEYQKVVMSMSKDDRDLFANLIYAIERIENPELYEMYEVKKKIRMSGRSQADANVERTLWHGTDEAALDSICQYGFNRGYCGKNGYVYGKGVYYAQQFSYSADDRYSKPDKSGLKRVLRCRVLTGQFTVGVEDMVEPPRKPDKPSERYDSTVDDDSNPTVFVIYNDYQSYPEYIVTFFDKNVTPPF